MQAEKEEIMKNPRQKKRHLYFARNKPIYLLIVLQLTKTRITSLKKDKRNTGELTKIEEEHTFD